MPQLIRIICYLSFWNWLISFRISFRFTHGTINGKSSFLFKIDCNFIVYAIYIDSWIYKWTFGFPRLSFVNNASVKMEVLMYFKDMVSLPLDTDPVVRLLNHIFNFERTFHIASIAVKLFHIFANGIQGFKIVCILIIFLNIVAKIHILSNW